MVIVMVLVVLVVAALIVVGLVQGAASRTARRRGMDEQEHRAPGDPRPR